MYTAATAFLEALVEAGVSHLFVNLGSDHPALVEAIAESRAIGRKIPKVITCPSEMAALSAAHGFYQASGVAQAVIVHVECGTQSLGGAVHNAAKGRLPVLIFAGASPFTQEGELKGSRNEFIHWIQDVHDQRGIVRGYMKYDAEIRTGRNIKQMVHRALQIAYSDPKGPVYLMAAREVLEEEIPAEASTPGNPIAPTALSANAVESIAGAMIQAKRPLVVTSYIGRNPEAVRQLVKLCSKLGAGVLESVPNFMNFPANDPLYLGNQWHHPWQNPHLAEADVILLIDSDVPWIPKVSRPAASAEIYHIDVDPLKEQMPLWHIPANASFRADAATALAQINAYLDGASIDAADRINHYSRMHAARKAQLEAAERLPEDGVITVEYLMACLREHVDESTVVLNEAITYIPAVCDHLALTQPGSMLQSGGGSLGWSGGAAVGVKLASPESTVMAIIGDGSFLFSAPSSVYWMARRYKTPFLQIVLNNQGWRAPKLSLLAQHPDGYASRADNIDVTFDTPPDYSAIAAAAGGAYGHKVQHASEVKQALAEALQAVRGEKRCAVLDVTIRRL